MSPENQLANAAAELQRAADSLRAGEVLLREGLTNDAVSRAYYASFHATRALLFTVGIEARSHRGALHLFNLHFVKTGKLDANHLAALARSQYDRTSADYGATSHFEPATAEEELSSARALIEAAKKLIPKSV